MKKIILITIISLLFTVITSCVSTGEVSVSKIEKLHGLTENEVTNILGNPIHQEQYKVKNAIGEFRKNVFKFYPLSKPENQNVEIKELRWKDGDYFISMWFHLIKGEWVVMDTCRWHESVQF